MKKSTRRKILSLWIATAALTTLFASISFISQKCSLSKKDKEYILSEIDLANKKVNDAINKLEQNKESVDTLKTAINEAEEILAKSKELFNQLNKGDLKNDPEILSSLNLFDESIKNLENKINDSKDKWDKNKKELDRVVEEARITSERAINRLNSTSDINVPGLKAANEELENALKEIELAKEKAKDSKEHIDNLAKLSKKAEEAEQKVKKLLKDAEKPTEDEQRKRFLEEIEKQKEILNQKIEESKNDNLSLSELNELIKDFEDKLVVSKDTNDYIKENTNDPEVLAKNEELRELTLKSDDVIEELKSREQKIKKEINDEIERIKELLSDAQNQIDSSNDFDELEIKHNEANTLSANDLNTLKEKVSTVGYDDVADQIAALENTSNSNINNSLNKLKDLVRDILNSATALSEDQKQEFATKINEATTPEQLRQIKQEIELANSKAKAINDINGFNLISDEHKQKEIEKVNSASSPDDILPIIDNLKKLNDEKNNFKEEINDLNNLSDKQKESLLEELTNSETHEKNAEVLEKAKDLNKAKEDALNKLETLQNLDEDEKNDYQRQITEADTKEEVERLIKEAEDKNNAKTDDSTNPNSPDDSSDNELTEKQNRAIEEIDSLSNIDDEKKEQLKENINNANNSDSIDAILLDAKNEDQELGAKKEEYKLEIDKMEWINKQELEELSTYIGSLKGREIYENSYKVYELLERNNNKKEQFLYIYEEYKEFFTQEYNDKIREIFISKRSNEYDETNKILQYYRETGLRKWNITNRLERNRNRENMGENSYTYWKNFIITNEFNSLEELDKLETDLDIISDKKGEYVRYIRTEAVSFDFLDLEEWINVIKDANRLEDIKRENNKFIDKYIKPYILSTDVISQEEKEEYIDWIDNERNKEYDYNRTVFRIIGEIQNKIEHSS
ncbi:hypothetical protein [Metamycoplasma gateae]|uniref:Extracellular matrix-binding protein ebh GA module domain-containing protein n=1 Tax=Metamycoplasma gateae TaxID=35769 RepID=A0ABZ2AI12_9BACT|nr:hypothetical protein V2E26_01560 [Metamycoplasma gateae]